MPRRSVSGAARIMQAGADESPILGAPSGFRVDDEAGESREQRVSLRRREYKKVRRWLKACGRWCPQSALIIKDRQFRSRLYSMIVSDGPSAVEFWQARADAFGGRNA